jgi:hypothetical protein
MVSSVAPVVQVIFVACSGCSMLAVSVSSVVPLKSSNYKQEAGATRAPARK